MTKHTTLTSEQLSDKLIKEIDDIITNETVRIIQTKTVTSFEEAAKLVEEKVQSFLNRIFNGKVMATVAYDNNMGFCVIFND